MLIPYVALGPRSWIKKYRHELILNFAMNNRDRCWQKMQETFMSAISVNASTSKKQDNRLSVFAGEFCR
jgi:hypothetical protein